MKALVLVLIAFSFVMSNLIPSYKEEIQEKSETQPKFQLMVAVEDIQLQSLEFDISRMGILPAGSVVAVTCRNNNCLLDDLTTFLTRDKLVPIAAKYQV